MQEAESRSISTLRMPVKLCPHSPKAGESGPRPTTRSPTLCKNSAPAKSSDLTFPTRCWWWPVHHTQLCIWISNPEGAKEPPFVILDKQKSAVRQGLVFKGAKGLDGCHPALILSSGDFMLQMQDDNGAQGETN